MHQKKPTADKRTENVSVWLTEAEIERLDARRGTMARSAYLRNLLVDGPMACPLIEQRGQGDDR